MKGTTRGLMNACIFSLPTANDIKSEININKEA